jgi:hypothetical protein
VGPLLVGALLACALVGAQLGVHSLKDEEKIRSNQQRTSNEEQIRIDFRGRSIRILFGTSLVRSAKKMVSEVQRQIARDKGGATERDLPQSKCPFPAHSSNAPILAFKGAPGLLSTEPAKSATRATAGARGFLDRTSSPVSAQLRQLFAPNGPICADAPRPRPRRRRRHLAPGTVGGWGLGEAGETGQLPVIKQENTKHPRGSALQWQWLPCCQLPAPGRRAAGGGWRPRVSQ